MTAHDFALGWLAAVIIAGSFAIFTFTSRKAWEALVISVAVLVAFVITLWSLAVALPVPPADAPMTIGNGVNPLTGESD